RRGSIPIRARTKSPVCCGNESYGLPVLYKLLGDALMYRPNTIELAYERVLARSVRQENGCLLWQGGKCPNGYGSIRADYKRWGTHVLVWRRFNGIIPTGKYVCHKCDT